MNRATRTYLAAGIAAGTVLLGVWAARAPALLPFTAVGLIYSCAALTLLFLFHSEKVASVIFMMTTVMFAVVGCLNHEFFIRQTWPFEPFVGFKILSAVIPLLVPPNRGVGLGSVALFGLLPVQRYYSWDPQAQWAVGIQEPWVTFVFSAACAVIYIFRLRVARTQLLEAQMKARLEFLRGLTNLLLGTQHLLNTPLQSIELLSHNMPLANRDLSNCFNRAFAQIRRVSRVLSIANKGVEWKEVVLPANSDELEDELKKLLGRTEGLCLRSDSVSP